MKILRIFLPLIAFLLVVTCETSWAQETPKVEFAGTYTYVRANIVSAGEQFNLNGGSGSVAANLNRWLGIAGEIGAVHQGNAASSNRDLTLATFLIGPRITYRGWSHITPFAHVLIGGAHGSGSLYSAPFGEEIPSIGNTTGFALGTGGGIDVNVNRHFALRLFQADYLHTWLTNGANDRQNNFRLSAGVVFRFGTR